MKKKNKKTIFKISNLVVIVCLLLGIVGAGVLGKWIKNLDLYLFGITYYWVNSLLILVCFNNLLRKRNRNKNIKYLVAFLLIGLSFDLLINFLFINKELSKEFLIKQFDVVNYSNVQDGVGVVLTTVIFSIISLVGISGFFIVATLLMLTGIFILLDFDTFIMNVNKRIKRLIAGDSKKKTNAKKKKKNQDIENLQLRKEKIKQEKIMLRKEKQKKEQELREQKAKELKAKEEKNKKLKEHEEKEQELKEKKIKAPEKSSKIDSFDYVPKKAAIEAGKNSKQIKRENPSEKSLGNNKKYKFPSLDLLDNIENNAENMEKLQEKAEENADVLVKTLKSFKLEVKIKNIFVGPSITRYELEPEIGVKVNKFSSLSNDIAMAMAAKSVIIQAPIPGKSLIGIDIPNSNDQIVGLREILSNSKNNFSKKLEIGLGKNILGGPEFLNIAKTPHLLVAGATGSGKSVCINSIVTSILFKATPDEVKFLMIDPKKVELTPYNGIPHLLTPVITDAQEAAISLNKLVAEMEKRYDLFSKTHTRNIKAYNKKIKKEKGKELPYIVAIIDELADLMMVSSSEVETAIARLAQMARAAGIHLVIATQRPSTDVITGLIKSNIPSRIAFMVSSSIDSRTILDKMGAEKLLGHGDMLLSQGGSNSFERIQGAFLSDEEIQNIVSFIKNQFNEEEQEIFYNEEFLNLKNEPEKENIQEFDSLLEEAVQIALDNEKMSTSLLQRRLKIGYNRAANIVEQLEDIEVISPAQGNKARKILISNIEEFDTIMKNREE